MPDRRGEHGERAQRMSREERRAKAQGIVLARLGRARMRAAAVVLLKPLIERASVPARLKRAVLETKPSIRLEEFDEDVRDTAKELLSEMTASKMVTFHAGDYTLAADKPHLTTREAREYSKVILEGWPEEAKDEILHVFSSPVVKGGEPDNEKED